MNTENLKKLATYLLQLPEDYKHFSMTSYFEFFRGEMFYASLETNEVISDPNAINECRTVACALGHGPVAGIYTPDKIYDDWEDYCIEEFGFDGDSLEYDWCFAGAWHKTDDTPHGAAKRILYMIEYGVPKHSTLYMQQVSAYKRLLSQVSI